MKKLTVAICNVKGGTGKTSLSLALAYTISDHLGHKIIYETNDAYGPPEIERTGGNPKLEVTIQDFGGFVPAGKGKSDMGFLLNEADCLLVPIRYERLSLRAGKDILAQRGGGRKAIVIGTECSERDCGILQEALGFEVLRFRSSTAVPAILTEQRSPYEIAEEKPLLIYSWKGWFNDVKAITRKVLDE